jgi:16S rRNA (guanine527-N7)-methyltransferase
VKNDEIFKKRCRFFAEELLKWNKIHNLTGAKSFEEIEKNIQDSIYPLKFLPNFESLLDIGSGAGFPSLILSFKTKAKFYLTEPRKKRAAFLQYIKASLSLKNVEIFPAKVEEIASSLKVDLITSRAVAPIEQLISLSKKHSTDKTVFLFYKGSNVFKELKKIKNYKLYQNKSRVYVIIEAFEMLKNSSEVGKKSESN